MDFTPKVLEETGWGYTTGIMMVELSKCPICNKFMVKPPENWWDNIFPKAIGRDFESQLKKLVG